MASVSKQVAAATVLLLSADGVVDLGSDVHTYVPSLPNYGSPVTVDQLIHHTSGLPDYVDLMHEAGFDEAARTDDDALSALAGADRLDFRPATQHDYGDTRYFLLSLVVLAATAQSMREVAEGGVGLIAAGVVFATARSLTTL